VLIDETRGQWYLRQLRGSSNLSGGKLLHYMSGNLSHQIEHHMFPDVPGMRYAEMSLKYVKSVRVMANITIQVHSLNSSRPL
jgi:fatty acid desaturase